MGSITAAKEKIKKLSESELQQLLEFLDFLLYKREHAEDKVLASVIRDRMDDEYLTVEDAKKYHTGASHVENSGK
jgi:hypothetical protein